MICPLYQNKTKNCRVSVVMLIGVSCPAPTRSPSFGKNTIIFLLGVTFLLLAAHLLSCGSGGADPWPALGPGPGPKPDQSEYSFPLALVIGSVTLAQEE